MMQALHGGRGGEDLDLIVKANNAVLMDRLKACFCDSKWVVTDSMIVDSKAALSLADHFRFKEIELSSILWHAGQGSVVFNHGDRRVFAFDERAQQSNCQLIMAHAGFGR
jgi:hypothetical protein